MKQAYLFAFYSEISLCNKLFSPLFTPTFKMCQSWAVKLNGILHTCMPIRIPFVYGYISNYGMAGLGPIDALPLDMNKSASRLFNLNKSDQEWFQNA